VAVGCAPEAVLKIGFRFGLWQNRFLQWNLPEGFSTNLVRCFTRMTQSEHAEIVTKESEGKLRLGIDRSYARKFYTDVPIRLVQRETGEAPYFEKLVAFTCFLGSPITLLLSSIVAISNFGWWSAAVIPVSFIAWLLYAGRSAAGRSRLLGLTVVLLGMLLFHLLQPEGRRFTSFFLLFTLSLWLHRLLYIAATVFLRSFIIRNHRAFSLVYDHVAIRNT
jgi:hypothetical protein